MRELIRHILREERKRWTQDEIRSSALNYKRRKEFFDNDPKAYQAAKRVGQDFFNDITSHMEDGRAFQEVKWTEDVLKDLTSKYDDLATFRKENPQAAEGLYRRGPEIYNKLTAHMNKRRTPYTDDELRQIALKYNSASEFTNGDAGAQVAARNRGEEFYKDITKHFQRLSRDPYTFDEVKNEALKYTRLVDFQRGSRAEYSAAHRNGWLKDVTSHMIPQMESWNYDKVKEIASKYPTKKEFRDNNSKAYSWALNNLTKEQYDEITSHMEPLGNYANRMIYAFEFPDNSVYVGLTFNSKKRFNQHINGVKKSAVKDYMNKTGLTPVFKKHTGYMSKEDAIKMEAKFEEDYKNKGWNILNIAKTGALGSTIIKWTIEALQKEALKYNTRGEFSDKNASAYSAAVRQGVLDDITKHMTLLKKYKYTYNQLKDVTKKYTSLRDFREHDYGAYQSAKAQGWFDELTSHMSKGPKTGSKWDDFNKVKEEALKYTNASDFRKGSSGAYKSAFRNNWYDQISKHFKRQGIKWDYDTLKKESEKYGSKYEFLKGSSGAYQTAFRAGYLDDFYPKD